MNNIQVHVLHDPGTAGTMIKFLARLTQRGHKIQEMNDLIDLYNKGHRENHYTTPELAIKNSKFVESLVDLPHSTIKRFAPITVAIVGASRRFLAQARTHQVGITYVSGSLQYSDFSDAGQFVVPYPIMEADYKSNSSHYTEGFIASCKDSMQNYKVIAKLLDNDTAGYLAPQALRNVLVIQANHEAWLHFLRLRTCNRNTPETQYVALKIWEQLYYTEYGKEFFGGAGPACICNGRCQEGKFACSNNLRDALCDPNLFDERGEEECTATTLLDGLFPLLRR